MAIEQTKKFDAPAANLWAIVGTPDRTDWVPGVTGCEYDGEVRRLTMPGAGDIAERILSVDGEAMNIRYSCIESTPPLASHLAEITVVAEGDAACTMIWKTSVEPVEFEPFILQAMQASFDQLEKLLS